MNSENKNVRVRASVAFGHLLQLREISAWQALSLPYYKRTLRADREFFGFLAALWGSWLRSLVTGNALTERDKEGQVGDAGAAPQVTDIR